MQSLHKGAALLAGISTLLAAPLPARADVTNPFPGMTLVRHADSAMVIANLCAGGVSVRATRYAERQATPQAFAQGVGAQAAINADFFDFPGWSWVLVRARGAGEEWPPQAELLQQPSSYWQFGPGIAGIQPNSLVTPPGNITEVVGAYDPLIHNGQPVDQSGNGFMMEFHRRSAIGLSADGQWLYEYASNASVNGPGMIGDMTSLAAEAGAPPIGEATNQDGGGSSQLYVQGYGQVIDSGRQVNTHLAIYATGAGPAPNCPNHPPGGYFDAATCDAIAGWAQDPDEPQKSIDVHVYFDGPAGAPGAQGIPLNAGDARADLCQAFGCNHGFSLPPPLSMRDGKPHEVHAYAIDSKGGANNELAESPRTLTCSPLAVSGVKRWIDSPAVMAAWGFSWLVDVMPVADETLIALPDSETLPDAPKLVRADDGSPEVWLLDGNWKRHVPDPAAAVAWNFDLGSAVVTPASEVLAIPTGAPLRARPIAVRGSGPAVYLVDDPEGHLDDPPAIPDGGLDGAGAIVDAGADAGSAPISPNAADASNAGCTCRATRGSEPFRPLIVAMAATCALLFRRRRRG